MFFFVFQLRRVPVPDARWDFLVDFHKPARLDIRTNWEKIMWCNGLKMCIPSSNLFVEKWAFCCLISQRHFGAVETPGKKGQKGLFFVPHLSPNFLSLTFESRKTRDRCAQNYSTIIIKGGEKKREHCNFTQMKSRREDHHHHHHGHVSVQTPDMRRHL